MAFEVGSEISDSEAEKILTVGDAIKFIEQVCSIELRRIKFGFQYCTFFTIWCR